MTTETPFFEEEKTSLSAEKVWALLRRTFAFLLIFSMVSNDLAFAGRHGDDPGYSSDGEQQQHSPRRTPPSGSPLKRFNSWPDLTSYLSKTSLSSQTTSTRTPSEETLPHGSSSLGSSDESREQASSLKSSPEKDTIPSLGEGHEKKDRKGQSSYPSTPPIPIKGKIEPQSLSVLLSEPSRDHLSNGSSTPLARKDPLSSEDERDAPSPLQGQKRQETDVPRTSPLPVMTNGHLSGNSLLQVRDAHGGIPVPSFDDEPNPDWGSWTNIPQSRQFALIPLNDASTNGGLTERSPLLINGYGTHPTKSIRPEDYFSGGFGEDPREGRGPAPSGTHVAALNPNSDIDACVLAFLRYADKHIKRGRITWKQGLIGGIGGTLIGVGVGNAMPPILYNGLEGLGKQFNYEIQWGAEAQLYSDLFISHTAVTLGIDSISRNALIISDFLGPSTDKFSIRGKRLKVGPIALDPRKGLQFLVFTGAGFAALLPVYYLWHEEEQVIHDDPSIRTSALTFFWCLAPTLWLDSLFMNARGLQTWIDEKINTFLIRRAFAGADLASARQARQETLQEFDDLERLFRWVDDEDIHEIYEDVLRKGLNIRRNGIHFPEILEAGEGLRTLKALKKIRNTYDLPEEYEEEGNWKTKVSNVAGVGIPLLATVGRSLVFYTIIYHMLGDISLDSIVGKAVIAGTTGGGLASLFQGKVEVDAVKQGVYEFLGGEETECDASHSYLRSGMRKIAKGYNYLQGAWNTLPYLLVGIAATQGWPVAIQIATLLFFAGADMFNNAVSFNESYGGAIQGAESLVSYGYANTAYKRNKLLRMVRGYKRVYETMPPHVLMRSDELVSYAGNLETFDDQVFDLLPRIYLDEEEGYSD